MPKNPTTDPLWVWDRLINPERWILRIDAFVRVHGPDSVDIDGPLDAATLREVLRKMEELEESA